MVKVLFLQNAEHHDLGDIKDVPDGYARNFLIPHGLAVLATENEIAKWQTKLSAMKLKEEQLSLKLQKTAEKIEGKAFVLQAEAGEDEKLFGAVTNKDLAEILLQDKIEIDKHSIEILEPIHNLGEHQALIKLGHGIHANMRITVKRK